MTSVEFYNNFYRPAQRSNREAICKQLGITHFAGLSLKRFGWSAFVNALGDYYGLDIRDFTCQARFIEVLALKLLYWRDGEFAYVLVDTLREVTPHDHSEVMK